MRHLISSIYTEHIILRSIYENTPYSLLGFNSVCRLKKFPNFRRQQIPSNWLAFLPTTDSAPTQNTVYCISTFVKTLAVVSKALLKDCDANFSAENMRTLYQYLRLYACNWLLGILLRYSFTACLMTLHFQICHF